MCGIIAYVGDESALPLLIEGLRRMEYRGYDSAGVALLSGDDLWSKKDIGRVDQLAAQVHGGPEGCIGIAHTRWATHGGITRANAHPHFDTDLRIAVVHNGIIENMGVLKRSLEADGVVFRSETDTEVIPHLIRRFYKGDPLEAVRSAVETLHGTYGLAVLFADHDDELIVARHGSPLVIGLGDGETIVASDPQAIVGHTRRVIYLRDREMARIHKGGAEVTHLDGTATGSEVHLIDSDYQLAEMGGFDHFMLKEIHEQAESIQRALRGRIQVREGNAKLGGLEMSPRDLRHVARVVNIGCGTSYNAGLVGAMAIEDLARVPARCEIASEFRHRHPIVPGDALFFAISQSGETLDTLGAVEEVQIKGGQIMGVINVVGSTIARRVGRGVYVYSGPEIAVASTKAFTSQVTALLVFTLMIARTRNLSLDEGRRVASQLAVIPEKVQQYLADPGPIEQAAQYIANRSYVQFLGRGYSFPVALEGALKLKEIAYIPSEGYPAGEMKHGPIAMLEKGTPVILVAPAGTQRTKAISNLKEVQARGAYVIVVHSEGDEELAGMADLAIEVPRTAEFCSPLLTVIPLQLLAYRVALLLDRDIDKPRNLAKSVTVE